MFDREAPRPDIGAPKPAAAVKGHSDGLLAAMSMEELLELRERIDKRLPPKSISDINMEEELLLQLASLRALSNKISNVGSEDESLGVPLNQRAQLANSITSVLKSLIDRQVEVFSSERFKRIENLLVRHLRRQSSDFAKAFLDEYEAIIVNGKT